jgi:ribonuclease M5
MLEFSQSIIVEGKYDKMKLSKIVSSNIISIDGFDIYKNEAKKNLLKKIANETGIIILTDSDSAGNRLRNYIKSIAGEGAEIINLYIPEVLGKEKRKEKAGKEGKLGVEGMDEKVLREIVGAVCDRPRANAVSPYKEITNQDLYELGLIGKSDSKKKRQEVAKAHNLPKNLSTKQFLEIIKVLKIDIRVENNKLDIGEDCNEK